MKIAIWHNLFSGGGSRALHQHIKGLAERGHHLEVWTSSLADSSFLDVEAYIQKLHVLPLDMNVRIRYQYLDKLPALGFEPDTQVRRMLDFCRLCADEINAGGFDVLFANSCVYFMMPYIGRFVNIPKVLYLGEPNRALFEAHPDLVWEGLPSASNNWRDRRYWGDFWDDLFRVRQARVRVREEIQNFRSYDKVLVNSYFSSESTVRAYGRAGEVCYLGVDTNLFPFLDLPREPFVMGLGAFYPPKKAETAIEALAQIPANRRPPLIWIGNMGNHEYVAKLRQLSQQLNVQFEPRERISQPELIRLLNTASCLLYTSSLEPFGLAPLEANSCGLPVVAVAEGGVRETIIDGYNGLLRSRDPVALAHAVEDIMTNDALFERLSINARQVVRDQWTLNKAIDRVETALVDTVNGKKPALRPV
ncbi:MAG: glycosyltransferase family 4 protein [Bacteroidetes bacterium]|nr:glycosyltransferase family 4 protein [Fibrella sp.]